jgi:DNA-binding CsgD family transcriptional regulator
VSSRKIFQEYVKTAGGEQLLLLVRATVAGMSPEDIAKETGITTNKVRTQIRRLLKDTRCFTLTLLVGLVWESGLGKKWEKIIMENGFTSPDKFRREAE